MDKSLGDIMEWLQKKGCADNTIILFMSDNGGLALSPPRGGHSFTQNLPLRSGKGSVCEGGIREPMIVKWPGVVKPGSRTDRNVIIEDFFPTILDMAGVRQYHTVQTIDGKSFLPLLQGKAAGNDQRVLIWHFPNKWLDGEAPGHNYYSAIRQGDWKLLYNMRNGKTDLYNIRKDIREDHDLSAQYPDKTKSLLHLLATQLSAWQSPMPFDKTTGKEIRVNEK
jgi:arylsulfatase A-like enzyme